MVTTTFRKCIVLTSITFFTLLQSSFVGGEYRNAEFPGGDEALSKYLADSVRYPAKEKAEGLEEHITIKFDVSKTGKVENAVVMEFGLTNGFTDEALRLIKAMPLWNPAKQNGRSVKDEWNYVIVIFTLPDSLIHLPLPSADTVVFTEADSVPVFPGGDMRMYRFLSNSIEYPRMEKETGVMGTVSVSYVVEKNGRVTNVRAEEEVANGPGLTKETLRVVRMFPRHRPALKNGKAIRYRKTIPVKYILQ